MKTIDLVYFDAGGGHRASARALAAVVARQQRPWLIRQVNFTHLIDCKQRFERLIGLRPEDVYNRRLARGWTAGMAQELRLFQALVRLGHTAITRRLAAHWRQSRPDMVVSLIPNFNRALYSSLNEALPGTPFVTVLTDLADYPPRFWIERGQAQHLICGTQRAAEQARSAGYPDRHIHRTSGMILNPSFYEPAAAERAALRQAHGLEPQRPTALVMFGGQGASSMLSIAARLPQVQLILACGHNRRLAARLRALPTQAPRLVLGFTDEIHRYMDLADFFIGKPGPGSISEALRRGLPVIVAGNRWTMPQERYNVRWVGEQGVGVVVPSFVQIAAAVDHVISNLDRLRERVGRIDNRAVFEVPDILASLLAQAETGTALKQAA